MESTPRPIAGYTRSPRLPFPWAILTKGLRGLSRARPPAVMLVRPMAEEAIVEVRGALDAAGARRLKEAVALAFEEGAEFVTIDLSEATRLFPAGLAALVDLSQRAGGSCLRLSHLKPEARWLLEKAGLHGVLEIME